MSWFQVAPVVSLDLVDRLEVERDAAVVDVGAGASVFADHLLERGFDDVTLVDVSSVALAEVRSRLGNDPAIAFCEADILAWRPERRFDLWHDRAVLHFLVTHEDRDAYLRTLRAAIRAGGHVVLATFAADGPSSCSGLPVARYSVEGLAQLLGSSFEVLQTRNESHLTPGGVIQPFTWVAGRFHTD